VIVTVEENVIMGGAGSAVSESLSAQNLTLPILHLGLPDHFVEHGDPSILLADCGLTREGIVASIQKWLSDTADAVASRAAS
jgi:1-deoxy-D-xylulose-5-phosphate synthase